MEKLSKEELMKILAKAAAPKKERKKAERTAEQQKELTERLAKMREKSLENRAAKKKEATDKKPEIEKALSLAKVSNAPSEDIFEKKYGSTLEKLGEVLGRVDANMTDLKEMKRLKAEARQKEKEDLAAKEALKKPVFEPLPPKMAHDMPQPAPWNPTMPQPTPWNLTPSAPTLVPQNIQIGMQPIVPPPVSNGAYKFGDFKKMSFGKKRN